MRDSPNPEMLTLARESRGLNQTELARKTGLSQAAISKYENGMREIPNDSLEIIAQELGYPTQFFFRWERVYGYGSSCFYHRKQQSLPIRKLREIQATLNVRRLEVARLLQGIHLETDIYFDTMDIGEYDSPEQIAQLVRRNWRLPLGPVQNLIGTIEGAGGVVICGSFGTRKLDAISQWIQGQQPLFLVNKDVPGDRLRWTLAHEIGHIVMHRFHSDDQEREANRFAAEFLMPEKEIKPELRSLTFQKLSLLKRRWKVAMQALIRRAHTLKQITDSQYRRFFTQFNKWGYRVNEPDPIPQEEPSILRDVIEFHRTNHSYSAAELSYISSIRLEEFCSVYLKAESEQPRLRLVE